MASEAFYGIDIPVPLQELAERHQRHILDLVAQLREFGMDEPTIDAAVDDLIQAYSAQLLAAIKAVRASND